MRLLLQCAALCCALLAVGAQARPFTVDDLLRIDRRGEIGVSPDGRWLIISVTQGQAKVQRFDHDVLYPLAAGRLYRVDLDHPGPATFLMPQDTDAGYSAGAFSPDGQHLLINRLRQHQWELGVVEVATGAVRWFGVGADYPLYGRTTQWRSNTEVVAITTPRDEPDILFLRGLRSAFTSKARAITATGEPSVLSIGSGRFLDRGASDAPKSLARINIGSGEITVLTQGDFTDIEVSPSGRYVASYREAEDIQPSAQDVVRGGHVARRRELAVTDLDSGVTQAACQDCLVSAFLMAWAPTADRLLVFSRRLGQPVDQGRLVVVTPTPLGLDWRPVESVRPALATVQWGFEYAQAGWVGTTPAVFGRRAEAPDEAPAWLRLTRDGALPLLPAGTGTPDQLVADADGDLLAVGGGLGLRHRAGRLARLHDTMIEPEHRLGETGRPALAKLRLGDALLVRRKGRLIRLTAHGEFDLGAVPDQVVLASSTGVTVIATRDRHGVEEIRVVRRDRTTPVLTLNPQLSAIEFGEVRALQHKGPRGEALTSWLVLPPGPTPDQPPPLVIFPYPGRTFSASAPPDSARAGTGLWDVSPHVLAARGYAVLYPSLPRNRYPEEPSRGLAEEILNVVDAVKVAGLADTRRMSMWGHSFGGHAVLAAATQSDRFNAIIDTSGIADLVSAWGSYVVQASPDEGLFFIQRAAYLETGQMRVGAPPWSAPERYIANSPLFQADKITAPVLLAYGDLDAYSDKQGGEMFAALYRQGKDARLLTFFGEGHVITSPGNVRRLYTEVLGWLDDAVAQDRAREAAQARTP